MTPVSTSQFATVGGNNEGIIGIPGSAFSLPSIGGQWNRATMWLVDGVSDTEWVGSQYAVPPIVDTIEEFKVQMHNEKAEYGGVLGGVVSVISKGGTNNLHGSAYEFVRNNWFDARNPFTDALTSGPAPFRQNQFGGTVGGPLVIPKVYNGRNRTFFYFGYEGWRWTQSAESFAFVPTADELAGNFVNSTLNQPIYDPASTVADPSTATGFARTQFNYGGVPNVIPPNRIDSTVVNFITTYFDRPNLSNNPLGNEVVSRPNVASANQYNGRMDEQLGSKDNLFFRWSEMDSMQISPTSLLGNSGGSVPARSVAAGWNHIFSPGLIMEARGGFTSRMFARYTNMSPGMGPAESLGFNAAGGSTVTLSSPWGAQGIVVNNPIGSPTRHISGNLIWVCRQHNIKFGVQYMNQGNDNYTVPSGNYTFTNDTTADPNNAGTTGSSLASAVLGLPSVTNVLQASFLSQRMGTWSGFAQDQWKLRSNVTLTYGLRFDERRFVHPENAQSYVGGPVPETGDYWIGLNQMPGLCSVVGAAPCLPAPLSQIPGGNHIMLSPYGQAWGPVPEWDDWGPRVGVAWRLNEKTVVRAGYGVVYDPLSGIDQDWKGIQGGWPAASGVWNNLSYNQLPSSPSSPMVLTPIEQTFSKTGVPLPVASPWTQQNWYFNPYRKDARSQQWNVEVQREMTHNLALSIGYLGSYSDRLDETGLWNTATTPGEGIGGEPFPWWGGTNFMGTSTGKSPYNALEVKLERRFNAGFYYLVSYTWSKAIDTGSSGWFAAENGGGGGLQDYYDPKGSRGVSGYDIPQTLSMTGIYELPFGRGKRYFSQHGAASWLLGNWQTNAIVTARSGQPFTVTVSGDVADIGNTVSWWNYARPNLIGNPKLANRTAQEWFNTSAFVSPVNSYGNLGNNTLRSAPVYDVDFSLFKNFPVREGMNLQFRMEFFNVCNIQNLAMPNALLGTTTFGMVSSTVTNPRQIQLALRLTF